MGSRQLMDKTGKNSTLARDEAASTAAVLPHPPPPPPKHVELYQSRPLPKIPPTASGNSATSTISKALFRAVNTPSSSTDVKHDHHRTSNQINWAKEEAEIAVILDSRVRPHAAAPPLLSPGAQKGNNKADPGGDNGDQTMPTTPPAKIVSPQPKAATKIFTVTGTRTKNSPWSSPSGHNSSHKIKQLTGIEVPSDDFPLSLTGPSANVSPLSNRSSLYSQDLDTAVSEAGSLDSASSFDTGYASDPNSSIVSRRTYAKKRHSGERHLVPSPLRVPNIDKSRGNARQADWEARLQLPVSAGMRSARSVHFEPWQRSHPTGGRQGEDLYHSTTAQLARSAPNIPPRPPRDPSEGNESLLPHPQASLSSWMGMSRDTSRTDRHLTSYAGHRVTYGEPLHATAVQGSPKSSSNPFKARGESNHRTTKSDGYWHFHRRNHSNYPSPYEAPPPTPPPKPKADSSTNDSANSGKYPRGHHRSILSKVFRRASGPSTPPPTRSHTKTLSAPNVGSNSAPASAATSHHSLTSKGGMEPSRNEIPIPIRNQTHRYTQSASVSAGSRPGPVSAWDYDDDDDDDDSLLSRSPPLFKLPAAMASMGSLAAQKTGDMVDSARMAAGIWTKGERGRESLRSRIVVVGDGGLPLGGGTEERGRDKAKGAKVKGETTRERERVSERLGPCTGTVRGGMQGNGPWF